MAYISQERKKVIAAALKRVVPAGWKYSLSIDNHSSLNFNLKSAPVDIIGHINEVRVNAYEWGQPAQPIKDSTCINHKWMERALKGELLQTFQAIVDALNGGNHDNSDSQSDYFDVGWYVHVNVGKWDKPFVVA